MRQEANTPVNGIKIRGIARICIAACILLMVVIYIGIARVDSRYRYLTAATRDCLEGQRCAVSLERSSDYLTNQVRLFVAGQDVRNMNLYFEEVEGKNRENMVARLEALYGNTDPDTVIQLEQALKESQGLEMMERHAMRLVCYAMELSREQLPEEIAEWQLTEEEKSMSKEELINLAYDLVYGTGYLLEKQQIKANTQSTLDLLTGKMEERQVASGYALKKAFAEQKVFIFSIMALICLVFWIILALIVYPVGEHVRSIQSDQKWKILGAYELRYLAFIYNRLYDKNESYRKELEYKANHDALTGIYNRAAFEKKRYELSGRSLDVALILADVDAFKAINDTKGHEVGDETLKKVAGLLGSLELENKHCIARIGGDEFAVVLYGVKKEGYPLIEKEVGRINQILKAGDEVVPPVTISAGVSFSPNGYSTELFRQADQALYNTKKYQDRDCCMYGEDV